MTPDQSRPGLARVAVLGGVVAAGVLVAVLMLGSSSGYTVNARFINAGQLVPGNEVQVGGQPIGSVGEISLSDDGQADVELRIEDGFGSLHEGTTAVIRATSLSGIANRYVALNPGPNDAPKLADGGRVRADDTTSPVDLDQLFNTLDDDTRAGLRQLIQGSADQYRGKGRAAAEGLRYLSPALSSTSRLTREIARDQAAFENFIVGGARVTTSIAERRDDLAGLVDSARTTARAIGDESEALSEALGLLPATVRKANTTFANLRLTLDDLDTLVAESKPATRDLAPFLRRLRPLVRDARPTIDDLNALIRSRGESNDLVELTEMLPRLGRSAGRAFPTGVRALRRAQPVVEFIRPYAPELTGWLTKFAEGAANYDANGHFARVQPVFNPFRHVSDENGQRLDGPKANRQEGFQPAGTRRCPGGAVQPPPDRSAPYRDADGDLDCDPALVPPGP